MAGNETANETEEGQGEAEAHGEDTVTATAELPEAFDKADLRQFEADDVTAGSAICKMLSLLFIYTLIAMSCVSYWTWVVSS